MTYESLLSALQNTTADDDAEFVAELPRLIRAAELRIARDLDLEFLEELINLPAFEGNRWVDVPIDVVAVTSLWRYDGSRQDMVRERGYDYCLEYAPDEELDRAWPKYFAELRSPAEPEPLAMYGASTSWSEAIENEAQPQIQITHLAAWIEASYTTEFGLGQSGLSAAGSTGFEYDVGNPPWFATPPILNDLVAPPWSDNPPGPDNPLLPPDVWFPTLYIPAGIASGDFEGRTAHILYLVSEEPDSVSAVVTGDIGATLVGVTSLGAGSWFGRSGYGVLVEFMYDTANDLPEITDFAITVTVEATVGASTLNSVSNILHKYVTF